MRLSHLYSAALLCVAVTASAQTKALRFAAVVDPGEPTPRVVTGGVIIVDGDKIARVLGASDAVPRGAHRAGGRALQSRPA